MYQFSDIETTDSEDGIRYKTDSTKTKKNGTFPRNDIELPKNKTIERSECKRSIESKSYRNYRRSQDAQHEKRSTSRSRDHSRTNKNQKHKRKHSRSKSRERSRRHCSEKNMILKINDGKGHKDRKSFKHRSSRSSKSYDKLEMLKDKSQVNSRDVNQLQKTFPETIKYCINKDDNCKDQNILKRISLSAEKAAFIPDKQEVQYTPRTAERIISDDIAQCAIGPMLPKSIYKSINCKNENVEVRSKSADSPPTTSSKSEDYVETLNSKLIVGYEPSTSLNKDEREFSDTNTKCRKIGPELPPHLLGHEKYDCNLDISTDPLPKLPSNLKERLIQSNVDLESEAIGPALPPHLLQRIQDENHHNLESFSNQSQNIMGPTLPAHLRTQSKQESTEGVINDDDVYGPLPIGSCSFSAAHIALEERALQMKIDSLQAKDQKKEREEWMIALPEVSASKIGLGPRQFRTNPVPDMSDRSSWTDIPSDKINKISQKSTVDVKKLYEMKEQHKRDKLQDKIIKEHKKQHKRDKSLLEIHQKTKKEKDSESAERRPFSRDVDLKVNRFDEAQKNAIIKKAQLLDDRFSCGEAKFL